MVPKYKNRHGFTNKNVILGEIVLGKIAMEGKEDASKRSVPTNGVKVGS